jgi:hypothetical protein
MCVDFFFLRKFEFRGMKIDVNKNVVISATVKKIIKCKLSHFSESYKICDI